MAWMTLLFWQKLMHNAKKSKMFSKSTLERDLERSSASETEIKSWTVIVIKIYYIISQLISRKYIEKRFREIFCICNRNDSMNHFVILTKIDHIMERKASCSLENVHERYLERSARKYILS